MIGKTLGSYEVQAQIGKGGMGEVYRAQDQKLYRDVAIKILPKDFADDPVQLKRFHQEAMLLASLNHPNLAAVYDLDQEGEVRYLVQELVHGKTLFELLREGPLDIEDSLKIARQIASGLEAAHGKGIIHRDLKPSNVMVTSEGVAKVLDFGLAMPLDVSPPGETSGSGAATITPSAASNPWSESPTLAGPRANVILGTAPYMSPDQARGKQLDQRTDVWSFGCVLFEMIAGQKAFGGETLLDTLSQIVRGEPDWDAMPPPTPPRIRMLIRRCLQRQLRRRVQHIGDARVVIDEIINEPELYLYPADGVADAATSGAGVLAGDTVGGSTLSRAAPWAVAAVAVAVAAGAIWRGSGNEVQNPPPVRTSIALPAGQQLVGRPTPPFAISPDGDKLAYLASVTDDEGGHAPTHERQLYLRDLASFESEPIPGTEGADHPFFSPDGEWIGFFSADNTLNKVPVSGGTAQEICVVAGSPAGASWGPDGFIVFATRAISSGLSRVSADGGIPESITSPMGDGGSMEHVWPYHLPGGNNVIFSMVTASGPRLAVVSLETREVTTIGRVGGRAQYVSTSGHLVYDDAGQLMAVPFDPESLVATGAPLPVVEELYFPPTGNAGYYAVAGNGMLVYVPGEAVGTQRTLVWVDSEGNEEPLIEEPGGYGMPRISPEGDRVAVTGSGPAGGGGEIYVIDITRGSRTRITGGMRETMPVWSPDGTMLVFASSRDGPANIYERRADGGGQVDVVLATEISKWPRSWSPDGAHLAYYEVNPETKRDIWTLPLDGENEPLPFLRTEFNERAPMFSPDGEWIAYVSNESGRDEIYVRSFPEGERQSLVSTGGGSEPMWSRDGSELYYRLGDRMIMVPMRLDGRFFVGVPEVLFEGHYAMGDVSGNQYYDVGDDGRFLMIKADAEAPPPLFNLVLHWFTELEELLPTEQ